MKIFLKKYHKLLLILIISFAFFSRVIRIHEPQQYMFDEVYHAITAKLIARNDPQAFEWWNPPVEKGTAVDWLHPPYAKYSQAFFIKVYGENTFAWRISSVIFGVLVIVLVYKLAQELFDNKNLSLLATLLASFDGLLLTQSRIAMNDIHVTFFILLTFLLYLKYRRTNRTNLLIFSGVAAGFAMGTKWSGLFALLTLIFFEGIDYLYFFFKKVSEKRHSIVESLQLKKIGILFISLIVIPFSLYILSYSHMFLQGKSLFCFEQKSIRGQCYFERFEYKGFKWEGYISHFGELHRQIWWYQTNLDATHTYQSRPYQWFLNLRPVWFHVDYQNEKIGNIYAQGNSIVFWTGDIAVIALTLLLLASKIADVLKKRVKRLKKSNLLKKVSQISLHKNLFFLIFVYCIVWLPWQLSPRIMFFYHYTPAVPLLTIILAYALIKIKDFQYKNIHIGKYLVSLVIILSGLYFVIFYPNWTGIVLPKKLIEPIYFAITSWK